MPDPVEQDFTADGSAYLNVLLAMSAATDKWAQGVLDDVALVQLALDSLHGETINIGVDTTGLGQTAAAIGETAAATEALNQALTVTEEIRPAQMFYDTAAATQDQGNAALFATTAMGVWAVGLGVAHLAMGIFGSNIIADAVGITAFGIAATRAIGPVVTSLSTLTTSYGTLDSYQRAAALSLQNFLNSMGGNQAQIFTVFNQALDLLKSNMGAAGGVTSQASIAFMDFFAMLRQQFSSTGWVDMFSRSTGVIRTDMDALFGLFNNLLGLVPGLVHDFNGLGLGVIGFAGGLAHAVAAVLNFDPSLTRMAAGVGLAATAWHLLGNSISWVPAMGATLGGLATNFTKVYAGARIAGQSILGAGIAAAGALPAFAAIGAEGIAFVTIANSLPDPVNSFVGALARQNDAIGTNITGYQNLASALNQYVTREKQLPAGMAARDLIGISQAQAQAAGTARTLSSNFSFLNATLGMTRAQAMSAAQATGVNLNQSLQGSSQAAQMARDKMAAYEQTLGGARQVESQFAFDMNEAKNATLSWTTRLQGLATAFQVLSGPLLGAMNATAAFKLAQQALNQAEDKNGQITGTNTVKQALLTQQLAATAQAAMTASTNIFNQAKETGNAANAAALAVGPLVAMKDQILDLGLKGKAAAALVAQLNAEIAALHSKTVTITTIIRTLHQGGNSAPTRPGQAAGTAWAAAGTTLVGEQGPELVVFGGGERVIPATPTRSMLAGGGPGGGPPSITVNVYNAGSVLSDHDLTQKIQQVILDKWTRSRSTGFSPYGFGLR